MYILWIGFIFGGCIITETVAFLDSFPINTNCTEFSCRNNRCITESKRCDGQNDCLDNSDEEDCDIYHCSEPFFFKCKNKKCVSSMFVCDSENDCGDFSDESDCKTYNKPQIEPTTCVKGEWMCSDKICIPSEFVCNGETDCFDGSDETIGCTENIVCETFKCKNGHCIPNEWQCDGNDDCKDNTDEIDCENFISPKNCKIEDRLFLCKNNHTCLKSSQVCNNITDCPDGSDEGSLCNGLKTCKTLGCSHDCVNTPTGPKCLCPKGYLTVDSKTCTDINECEHYGICDHKCHNTEGSFECTCDYGYSLQDDKRTCKAAGGEALMVFSSKTEIRGYYLESEVYFPVARNLKQVVGVAFDGEHVYWTDIFTEYESIMRSLEDGSQKELLVTAGLGAPEDLAVDWITGNIYFTDSELSHIGVCTNDGRHCTVLINEDIHKPRGIVLHPQEGEMYWSDWGKRPLIARSKMDGSNPIAFVATNIHWPNGITIDYSNERLYWADAKLMTIESIKLDGTDRRVVLENIVKHPYAIAIFENRLYWSDWATHSIQSCDKFTGKNHSTLIKEKREYIYGLHIYHSVLKQKFYNPCSLAFCSDICLLSGSNYKCFCPDGKELSSDKHICKVIEKKEILVVGSGNTLIRIEHKILGKHDITALPTAAKEVGVMAYNDVNDTLYVYDVVSKVIVSMDLTSGNAKVLNLGEPLGSLTAMSYDYLGNNLYWCDSEKATVEVLNIDTMARKVIIHDLGDQIPIGLTLVPEEGIMFVAFEKSRQMGAHIDRIFMDGSSRTHVIEEGLLGPVSLMYDHDLRRVYWADSSTGNIESTSIDGDDRHGFRSLQTSPLSITSLREDILWTNMHSKRVYWGKKHNSDNGNNKRITLDVPDSEKMYIIALTSVPKAPNKCQVNNGGCSHLCLLSGKNTICACPIGMNFKSDNKTCFKPKQCDSTQFHCLSTDTCIPRDFKCNGKQDCFKGEDEENCSIRENKCSNGRFQCDNGECIETSMVCDLHYDCKDKSDENNCDSHTSTKGCLPKHFRCNDDTCIGDRYVCDGVRDCLSGEDEERCNSATCSPNQFRCLSGACIPLNWECDGEYDCSDLSDEHIGCAKRKCASDKYTCDNGKCIDRKFVCDKIDDCGDLSDESTCQTEGTCRFNEFQCTSNSSICIPEKAVCNGTSECPHHEDERNCSNCHVEEFECKNKKCIPTAWICDRADDCGDNSDEIGELCNHSSSNNSVVESVPCTNGFRCKTGHCIEMSMVCNNEENCYDGSDEHGACKTACQASSNPCSHKCIKTPSGPTCDCNSGYRLLGDGHTCVDIEECKLEPPLCSQLCTETTGSFICDCYEGFVMRSDKTSCKSIGNSMNLLYTVDNEIRQLSKSDNTLSILYSDNTPSISGLDVSTRSNLMYFTIKDAGSLSRKNLSDGTHTFITDLDKPGHLAVDWISENVYYVDGTNIKVCNFKFQKCAKILNVDVHSQISAISVDAVNKYIFYTVTNWWIFNTPSSIVYRCNLDGTKIHELTTAPNAYINGITYDLNKRKIYYSDQHLGNIYRINYDGSDKIITFPNITRPIGLQLFEDHLYFLTTGGYLEKCNLFGNKRECSNFRLNGYSTKHFALSQEDRQPKREDICFKHNCTNLCIPSDVGVRCLCENGVVVIENEECNQKIGFSRSSENVEARPEFKTGPTLIYKREHQSSGSIAALIIIPTICIIALVGGYVYFKKRRSGQFYVNPGIIRFTNKTYWTNEEEPSKLLEPGQHEYCNPIEFKRSDLNPVDTNKTSKLISFDN